MFVSGPHQLHGCWLLLLLVFTPLLGLRSSCLLVYSSTNTNTNQVHVVKKDGSNQLLQTFNSKPTYSQLEVALKEWPEAASNKSLMERLKDEVKFIQDTAQQQQPPKE